MPDKSPHGDALTAQPIDAPYAQPAADALPRGRYGSIAGIQGAMIMMVDDEPLNIDITEAFLAEAGFHRFVSTTQPEHALDLLRTSQASLLLLDLSMPQVSGIDILIGMRADPELAHLPVIVLTAAQDPQSRLQALANGAMDFLPKPVDPSELVLRIRNTLAAGLYRDYIAQHDGLTDLPNQLQYSERLEALVQAAALSGEAGAVIQVGVDALGILNETLGGHAGDAVLQRVARQLARRLQAWTGPGSAPGLYRLQGDRFALVVPGLAEAEPLIALARGLLQAAEGRVNAARNMDVKVSCCIGIALYPDDGEGADELIAHARMALRHARALGRGRHAFYRPAFREAAFDMLYRDANLGDAICNDQLQLFYAPRMDARTHGLAGAQAFARWTRGGELVMEGDGLLALASSAGLGNELLDWTLQRLLRDVAHWQALGLAAPRIGFGALLDEASGVTLERFFERASHAGGVAQPFGLELHHVGRLLGDAASMDAVHRLRRSGAWISLAGFGSAECPLGALSVVSPDEVILPAAFSSGSHAGGRNAAYVRAVLSLLAGLGVAAVAQGVDMPGQLADAPATTLFQGRLAGASLSAARFAQAWLQK